MAAVAAMRADATMETRKGRRKMEGKEIIDERGGNDNKLESAEFYWNTIEDNK